MLENEQHQKSVPIDILLAEDNEADVKIAQRAFKKSKIQNNLYVVNDGQEVIKFIHNEAEYHDKKKYPRPDFILLDINMPKMSGLEVLRRLKSDPNFKAIPVAILTSSKNDNDVNESYEKGACSYIPKPVHYDEFVEVVNSFGVYWNIVNRLPKEHRTKDVELSDSESVEDKSSQSILIIDDDHQHIRVMSIILEKSGFMNVYTAETGEEGLEVARLKKPSVVILDTVLPKKNGFEVCFELKNMNDGKIKVILNTGVIDAVNARQAKDVGADEYLAKTLDSKNIVEAVKRLLNV